jgi:hypothetical protein
MNYVKNLCLWPFDFIPKFVIFSWLIFFRRRRNGPCGNPHLRKLIPYFGTLFGCQHKLVP